MFSFGDQEAAAKAAANKKKSRRVSLADRSRAHNDENTMPPSTPRGHRGLAGKGASLQTQQQAFIQVCCVWEWPTFFGRESMKYLHDCRRSRCAGSCWKAGWNFSFAKLQAAPRTVVGFHRRVAWKAERMLLATLSTIHSAFDSLLSGGRRFRTMQRSKVHSLLE